MSLGLSSTKNLVLDLYPIRQFENQTYYKFEETKDKDRLLDDNNKDVSPAQRLQQILGFKQGQAAMKSIKSERNVGVGNHGAVSFL